MKLTLSQILDTHRSIEDLRKLPKEEYLEILEENLFSLRDRLDAVEDNPELDAYYIVGEEEWLEAAIEVVVDEIEKVESEIEDEIALKEEIAKIA